MGKKKNRKKRIEDTKKWKKENPMKVKEQKDRWRTKHREDIKKTFDEWKEKNKNKYREFMREYSKKYYQENKEKCVIMMVAYNKLRKELLKKKDYLCEFCGNKNNLDIHHKVYSNANLKNLMVLCRSCHLKIHKREGGFN